MFNANKDINTTHLEHPYINTMQSRVPVVTTHTGVHTYFKNAVQINAKFNTTFVIGDNVNCKLFDGIPNIHHVDFGKFITDDLIALQQNFLNFSPNPAEFEYKCFERFYLLRGFMKQYHYDRIFYVDSDCIMLQNVDDLLLAHPEFECGMAIEEFNSCKTQQEKMAQNNGCIHNSLLTLEYVETFIQLCHEIYVTQTKLELLSPKIRWFQTKRASGVSDMTVCYLIYLFGLYDKPFFNTEHSFLFGNEMCSFDHHIRTAFGYLGDDTYLMNPGDGAKYLEKVGDKMYATTVKGNKVRLLTLHFQGTSKRKLEILSPSLFQGRDAATTGAQSVPPATR